MIRKINLLYSSILLFSILGCGSGDTTTKPTNNTIDNNETLVNNASMNDETRTNDTVDNNENLVNEITLNYPLIKYDLKEFPSKIILSSDGTKLYVLNEIFGVTTIDIQDINNPFLINTNNIFPSGNQSAYDIISSPDNKILYMGVSDGIYIYDTTNFNDIVFLGKIPNSFVKTLRLSKDGKTLYAKGSNLNQRGEVLYEGGLLILDVANLNNINILSFYNLLDIKDIQLSKNENLIYLASGENSGGMDIIDISNPTQPRKLSSLFTQPTEYVSKIILSEDETKAYVANNTSQEIQGVTIGKRYLTVVNIENPNNPKVLNSSERYASEYINFGMELSLNEQNIYIGAGSNGFTVTSILNDEAHKVGTQKFNGAIIDFVLSLDKTLAYLITDKKELVILQVESI